MTLIFSGISHNPTYTQPLYGLHGKYTLSHGVSLPYFLSAMPIERAISELKVHEQISPSLDNTWTLRELFQREIDTQRVEAELVKGYLADPQKLKFFNALTIVLMPKDDTGKLLDHFPPSSFRPPIPHVSTDHDDAQWQDIRSRDLSFGDVQYTAIGTSGRIRWNPETVHAVAVDGQHRLRALQLYHEITKNRSFMREERETTVPVLFVLISPAAGFENESGTYSIRNIARELFTDLNKNAKKVDRARELILDDWSIIPSCVRTLLTEDTATDSATLIPLTLVRWQDPNNRFDTQYFLNSLTNLETLVSTILAITPPNNPMDEDEVLKFIQSVNSSLSTSQHRLLCEQKSLEEVYREQYFDDQGPSRPLSRLPDQFLRTAVSNFETLHKPYLLKLLLSFAPYKRVLTYARQHDLIEGVFGKFLAQTRLHRNQIQERELQRDPNWKYHAITRHEDAISTMKNPGGGDWSFKAIFQAAMARLSRVIVFENPNDPNLGTIDDLLSFLNELHAAGLFTVDRLLDGHEYGLWTFIGTNPTGGKIKVAKTTEDRILAVLRVWYYAHRKLTLHGDGTTARRLLQYFSARSNESEWPSCASAIAKLEDAVDKPPLYGGARTSDVPEKKRRSKIRSRLVAIIAAGILPMHANAVGEAESDDFDEA